jgi:hypothetical protein
VEVACQLQAVWRSGRSVAVAAGTHQWRCHLHPFSPQARTATSRKRGELEGGGGGVAKLEGVGE